MPITLDLRQAIIHKVHGQTEADLRAMIEGSVDGPEAALPGMGVLFELMWKEIDPAKKEQLITMLHEHLKTITPGSITS